jgi:hypothetical protein
MNLLQIINSIVVMIGLPAIIGACVYVGRKLQILDALQSDATEVKKNIKSMQKDLIDVGEDLSGSKQSSVLFRIKHNIRIIADHLTKTDPGFEVEYLKTMSPFQLNDEGEKLLQKSGFKQIVKENSEDFLNFIGMDKPKTKYDVQETAYKGVFLLFDEDYFVPVKTFLYNNPKVTKKAFLSAAAIYIRDVYLKAHPEIKE